MVDPAEVLPKGRSRETKIHRDASGRWYNDGAPITHPLLARAFDGWLRRAPDGSGRWCLENDINWAFVEIEGAPRFVRSARIFADRVELALSDGTSAALLLSTLRQGPDEVLYCDVPGPGGELLGARFDAHAVMQLSGCLGEDARGVYLDVGGHRFHPPVVDDPLASR